jgi:hypothetical protein
MPLGFIPVIIHYIIIMIITKTLIMKRYPRAPSRGPTRYFAVIASAQLLNMPKALIAMDNMKIKASLIRG